MTEVVGTLEFYLKTQWMTVGAKWGMAYRGVVWCGELYEAGQCVYLTPTQDRRPRVVLVNTIEVHPRGDDKSEFLPYVKGTAAHYATEVEEDAVEDQELLFGGAKDEGIYPFDLVQRGPKPQLLTESQFESSDLGVHCFLVQGKYDSETKTRTLLKEDQVLGILNQMLQREAALAWRVEADMVKAILPYFSRDVDPSTLQELSKSISDFRDKLDDQLRAVSQKHKGTRPPPSEYQAAVKRTSEKLLNEVAGGG